MRVFFLIFCIADTKKSSVMPKVEAKSTDSVEIRGHVAPGFEPVKEVFAEHFRQGVESEAQCCAYVGEEKVVDLWASVDNDPNYSPNKLAMVFSSTKSITSVMVATLVDQELISYGDKV